MTAALARAASLACWSGPVDPQPLGGGITNTNFVVADRGRTFVVRIGEDIPVHQISRANELAASRAAHAAGLSPAVVHAEPGALVLDFIEGRTFTPQDVRDPANREALVALVRRCHREMPKHFRGPAAIFWVFHVLRDYGHTLREGASRHLDLVPRLLAEAQALERGVGPVEIVFGHNDLLPGNVLDDGRRLWLVDWDYAGFNSPLFDLGGLASNSELEAAAAEAILELYHQRPVDDDLRRRAAAMTAASLLRETMWSMVSEIHSRLAFDYAAYTADNLARYQAAYRAFAAMR
ncbi:choline kinase family protein [Labrys wisconsinensis]|uniref:Thiamine kinase-like enzyme n=1 Tax=Labrys wisconsinensis TaxID=425677 RepID=A0ABU0JHI3_9HYPH|nr:choline kinase family protein [Labrys wisconsinensis]MDQ0473752.1 thiamine kinase-like enzyme [Labrys wisconsinensis]